MTNVLFVTWDGPNSTYLTGLFLPIFRALEPRGFRFHVLQFGWGGGDEIASSEAACAEAGVPYRSSRVWRRPVAFGSLASAVAGSGAVRNAIRDWSIDVLMPRSYMPALAAIPAGKARGLPVLLDADGLPNDERVEFAGASTSGVTHRLLSALERFAIRNADALTVRTQRAAEILSERAGVPAERFTVVANARDSALFRPSEPDERRRTRQRLGVTDAAPVLVFAGTALGGKYRGDLVRDLFRKVHRRRTDSRLLMVMPEPSEARRLMDEEPDLAAATIHAAATQAEMPALLGAANLGLSLIRPSPSMQAASAVKTGEYLLCGVPVLASAGVGGVERIVGPDAGLCLTGDDPAELEAAAQWFCGTVLDQPARFHEGARRAGLKHFSLDRAIPAYEAALRAAMINEGARQ